VHHFLMEPGQHEEDYYPSTEDMFEAFLELGWIDPDYLDQDDRMEYEVMKMVKHMESTEYNWHRHSYIDGTTLENQARAILAGTIWEQKEKV
jgi:hypothetical protein